MDKKFNSIRYSFDLPINNSDEIRINKLLKLIGKNKNVLDLGCWDGSVSEMIRNNNNIVSGIEISDNAITKARARGINVYDLDLSLDWQDEVKEKYDAVVAGEIIEHIFDTDRFLYNVYKALKEDGCLVLSTPNIASLGRRIMLFLGITPIIETTARINDAGHIRYFTFNSLNKLLKENGFKITNFVSDCVNFNISGSVKSSLLSHIYPKIGRSLIIKAIKTKK
jgi:methionine biosynthesis protein MetW